MSCEELFLEKLSRQGFRMTVQREIVLSVLHGFQRAASAEDIYGQVREASSAVDISTVYRTLELLQEFGLVVSSDSGSGHRMYKLVSVEEPHFHLVCRNCGKVIGVETDPADKLAAFLAEHHRFQMDLEHFHVPGRCKDCSAAEKRRV